MLRNSAKKMKSHRLGKKYFQNIFAKELTTRILSEEALQIAVNRREAKTKGEKERYTHMNAEFQRIPKRDKKAFLSDQCKK